MPSEEINQVMPVIKLAAVIITILVVASIVFGSIAIVGAGQRGVLLTWGKVEPRILDEGINTITPLLNQVVIVSVQTQKYSAKASSASADLQIVSTEVTLNYHLQPQSVNWIYQQLTLAYEDRIIAPAIQESVKASTAKFTAEELITKRQLIKDSIENVLKERLANYSIIVESVYLTDFAFGTEFTQAIEAKVTAQQLALKAENDLRRIEVEAQQAIATANGTAIAKLTIATAEAKAIQLQGEALKANPEIIRLRTVEKWTGLMPQYLIMSGNENSALAGLILNLPDVQNSQKP
jgi:regulator of protease activity HflC (stomatin/prohibitin superfamily)